MHIETKGVYPKWASDEDIINQVLQEMMGDGGHIPYIVVVNPSHVLEMQTRMTRIMGQMVKMGFIFISSNGEQFEITTEGRRAAVMGYRKYITLKKWGFLSRLSATFRTRFLILFLLVVCLVLFLLKIR
jgi:hypothetical protein